MIFNRLFVLTVEEKEKPITVVYVPSHLYHMVFELFKVGFAFQTLPNWTRQAQEFDFTFQNAMRATMELYGDAMEYPAIHAQVALGNEDLTVKVKPSCSVAVWRIVSLGGLCHFFSFAGERSWRRRATAEDRPVVYLHVLHSSPAQPGWVPCCSSGQWSRCTAPRQKEPIPKPNSPSCFPRLATDTASLSLDCTRATFRATWSSTPWRVMEPMQSSTSGWLILC